MHIWSIYTSNIVIVRVFKNIYKLEYHTKILDALLLWDERTSAWFLLEEITLVWAGPNHNDVVCLAYLVYLYMFFGIPVHEILLCFSAIHVHLCTWFSSRGLSFSWWTLPPYGFFYGVLLYGKCELWCYWAYWAIVNWCTI